ncbi:MAG: hypothetical protein U5L74_03530 [Ideonella sp.]|nr:hypothetical protein [Ideonella sp.]
MNWGDLLKGSWLEKAGVDKAKLKISFGFAEVELETSPTDADADAAWALYVELSTRITTQALPMDAGDEATALKSVYGIFALTRDILKAPGGRKARRFAKVAITVLNEVIRPFTAKWHRAEKAGAFADPSQCQDFRIELASLQTWLSDYANVLANIAGVPDLAEMRQP